MEHEIIALKWRPRLFSEVIGQEHITETLKYAISSGRIAPVYLFTGIRGTGKTTLARIMVKSLNCTDRKEDGEPCNKCDSCRETVANRNPDIIEIDGASHNSVEDVRTLKETISYGPVNSVYRAYIIDEVHMLSRSAFNALLKTLEEPPPRTVFILATTDPQKIPTTVLSRCQRYDLKRLMIEQITQQLKKILESENIRYDEGVLYMLAREGEGSMRDAQTLLEQMITFSGGEITMAQVSAVLGSSEVIKLRELIEAIISGDSKKGVVIVREIYRNGQSLEKAVVDVLHLLHGIVLTAELQDISLLDAPQEEIEWMQSVVPQGSRADWLRLFRFWSQEIDTIRNSDFTAILLESAVITAASFPSMSDLRGLYNLLKDDNRSTPRERLVDTSAGSATEEVAPIETSAGSVTEKIAPVKSVAPKSWTGFLLLLRKKSEVLWSVFHTVEYDEHAESIHLFLSSMKEAIVEEQIEFVEKLFVEFFGSEKELKWHHPEKSEQKKPKGDSQFQRDSDKYQEIVAEKKQQIKESDTAQKLEQLGFNMESVKAK